ncbi:MAG: hypothetical protein K2L82_05270 [Lachnospiraceae bacterium]|nr:hypothetical protein [Lachnospiraceae bacterium]
MLAVLTACGNEVIEDREQRNDSAEVESEENARQTLEDTEADLESGEDEAMDTAADYGLEDINEEEDYMDNTMKITAGENTFTATFADNSSAEALKELLAEGPLTINMSDYASMEKVGPIGTSLPRNDEQITTGAGDIILYQGNALAIYYDTNSWNFTRIGKINDVTQAELLEVFGDGDVTVAFSLD